MRKQGLTENFNATWAYRSVESEKKLMPFHLSIAIIVSAECPIVLWSSRATRLSHYDEAGYSLPLM